MSVENKLDKIQEDITDIKVTMAENTQSLKEHMRRTRALEQKLEPVEKHVAMVNGALKLIGLTGIIIGIVEGLMRIVK